MKNKMKSIIAASISTGMIAAATVAPSVGALCPIAPTNVITAAAHDFDQNSTQYTYTDSCGTWKFYVDSDNTYAGICDYSGNAEALIIPSEVTATINGQEVTLTVSTIYKSAIDHNDTIKSVYIPDTVSEIKKYAFLCLSGLTDITIPDTVTKIDEYIINICNNLKNINISEDVDTINFFRSCPSLETINNKPIAYFDTENNELVLNNVVSRAIRKGELDGAQVLPQVKEAVSQRINYIVDTVTDESDSDIEKARKLMDWANNAVIYDYDEYPNGNKKDSNHCDYSIFLNNTSVCDGFARGYDLLLHAAGIESYYVTTGSYYDEAVKKDSSHASNLVKIGNRYYLVDPTAGEFMYNPNIFKININVTSPDKWNIIKASDLHYSSRKRVGDLFTFPGDFDNDGKFTRNDTDNIRKAANGEIEPDADEILSADINSDGIINDTDASFWEQRIAREESAPFIK